MSRTDCVELFSASRAAAVELSTPPLMATAMDIDIRVLCKCRVSRLDTANSAPEFDNSHFESSALFTWHSSLDFW